MKATADGFDTVLVSGEVPIGVRAALGVTGQVSSLPSFARAADRPLRVEQVLAEVEHVAPSSRPTLIVTLRPIVTTGSDPLFGYADARRRVAIVSLARLGGETDDPRVWRRLANVVAHERGHLAGLAHCDSAACLMNRAPTVEGLDRRPNELCGRCAVGQRRGVLWGVVALLGLLLVVAGVDRALTWLGGPVFDMPFT
jgi:predicted Zn-dependent protease